MNTVASVPFIPQHWEQDQSLWNAWYHTLDIAYHSKQQYKQAIAVFYAAINRPIQQITAQQVEEYKNQLQQTFKPATIKRRMSAIQQYWRFAQSHKEILQ